MYLVCKVPVHFSLPLTRVGKIAQRLCCSVNAAALCQTPWVDLSGDYWSVHSANSAQEESWGCSLGFKNHFEFLCTPPRR